MDALEFSAKIEHGAVQLPEMYHNYENAYVRVIVLIEKPTELQSKKDRLLATFKKMAQVPMFRTIENPLNWQKQLRNEWD